MARNISALGREAESLSAARNELRADIRGHYNNAVFEVDPAPLRIGQYAVVKYLEQHIENIRVRLFDLIKKYYAVRSAAHLFRQLTALVIADIAGRRADKPRDCVLLHIFGHIEPYHRVLVAEKRRSERLAYFRFADSRRAEKDERARRTLWVFKSDSAAPYRPCDRGDRLILADYSAVQLILEPQQALTLRACQLRDGYPRPRADYFGYIICSHLAYFFARFLAPAVLCALQFIAELPLLVAYLRGSLELLRVHGRILFLGESAKLLLHIPELGRYGKRAEPDARRRLVYQVYRLVGQIPVADIPHRHFHRRFNSAVGYFHLVVRLVFVAYTLEYRRRLILARFADRDGLEAALERGILFYVLAVFLERRRAYHLQLAAGKRGL